MVASNYLSATETRVLLAQGRTTIDQVVRDHQARYDERNDQVKAWVHVDDCKVPRAEGLLSGVVIGIKDIINTDDYPTEHGSIIYRQNTTFQDAAVVTVLRQAGASLIGKTTVNEFALAGSNGVLTGNPFDERYRPGTSSAGSAAAVSDYQCHVAIGTQTAASVLRPASYCGVFGFKPTWGLVSLEGIRTLEPSIDSIGIFARSVGDIQMVSDVLGIVRDRTPEAEGAQLRQCRFAFIKSELSDSHGSESLKAIWENAKSTLTRSGATIEEVELGEEFRGWEGPGGRFERIIDAAASVACWREYTLHPDSISDSIADRVKYGAPDTVSSRTHDDLAALRPKFDNIASQFDAVITPSSLSQAPKRAEADSIEIGALWSGLHVPVINIPGFAGIDGLPIGLTMIAPRYQDAKLLHIGKLVARVFIEAGSDDLRKVPAPGGVVHLGP